MGSLRESGCALYYRIRPREDPAAEALRTEQTTAPRYTGNGPWRVFYFVGAHWSYD